MKAKIGSLIMLTLLFIMPLALADSPPSMPIRFDGAVSLRGEAVGDGTTISIQANEVEIISTSTINSRYTVHIPADADVGDATQYAFYVAGVAAGVHSIPDSGSYVSFDLVADDNIEITDEGNDNRVRNTGSGGGGGSGYAGTVLTDSYQTLQIGVGRGKAFKLVGAEHTVMLDGISGNTAKVTIHSDPVSVTLLMGETKELDLDPDSDHLLSVKLSTVTSNGANVLLKQVVRPVENQAASPIQPIDAQDDDVATFNAPEDNSISFSAITGAIAGLPDLSILENIYWIIAVFIMVVGLFLVSRGARQALKSALRKVLRGSNENDKK